MSIKVINTVDTDARNKRFYIIAGQGYIYAVYKEYPRYSEKDALDELTDYAAGNAPGIMGSIHGVENDHVKELRVDGMADGHDNDGDGYIGDYYTRAGNCGDWIEVPAVIELLTAEEIKEKYNEDLDIEEGK